MRAAIDRLKVHRAQRDRQHLQGRRDELIVVPFRFLLGDTKPSGSIGTVRVLAYLEPSRHDGFSNIRVLTCDPGSWRQRTLRSRARKALIANARAGDAGLLLELPQYATQDSNLRPSAPEADALSS